VLNQWSTERHSEGKPMNGPMIFQKAVFFYDEIKITDKCTYSEGRNKKLPVRT
jgi:hypothetical protein